MRKNITLALLLAFSLTSNASIGTATIDGKVYNKISMRPNYEFGRFGLGLDLYFYIDDEGGFYDKAWDFSQDKFLDTILDKIYYLRYNKPEDDFYFRIGGLSNASLGYGIIINKYNNMIEYPSVRRLGMDMRINSGQGIKTKLLVSDFKRVPGLIALRTEFPLTSRVKIGVFGATDLDMTQGLIDTDDDGYPDHFDDFPDNKDLYGYGQQAYESNQDGWDEAFSSWSNQEDLTGDNQINVWDFIQFLGNDVNTFIPGVTLPKDNISSIGIDMSLKITKKLTIYSQFAQMIGDKIEKETYSENLGWGCIPIGFRYAFGPQKFRFTSRFESRVNSKHFMYGFWDHTYDLNRSEIVDDDRVLTKRDKLANFGDLKGVYMGSDIDMFSLLGLELSYQHMVGETWNDEILDFNDDEENKSFLASLKINTSRIPKIKTAEIYYQRNNDPNPFDFKNPTTNTIHGYNLGVELSKGVMLIYKGRTTYVNDLSPGVVPGAVKAKFNLQVETQIDI